MKKATTRKNQQHHVHARPKALNADAIRKVRGGFQQTGQLEFSLSGFQQTGQLEFSLG